MAQKKDLNISPYYDDFDSSKNFYKVLFKPGFPVQARELTNLQSILQNQIEEFGTHMFKEGSIVIPGAPTYDNQTTAVRLNPTQFGTDITVYIDSFIGKVIEGQTSGVTGTVDLISLPDGGEIEDLTIFVKYINAGKSDNSRTTFIDGESLICKENVVYGNTTINAGTAFATLVATDANAIGSSASVADGVYFIRGTFVNVNQQTIILDPYSNTPSYRVGLQIDETIVTAKEDESLYDNAKGFTNYAAPGADRFKIALTLTKRLISDKNDTNFVEILRVQNGEQRKITTKTNYNIIKDWIAERTFEESGNYALQPFNISVSNSLNNRLGNNGIFFKGQETEQGNTPSDDLMCVRVSGGEAYVRGYDVNTDTVTILDAKKSRDTQTIETSNVPFNMGNILVVNNLEGQPQYRKEIDLYASLDKGSPGTKIGSARVYSCTPKDAVYDGTPSTKWNLRLYDIQTYTKLELNASVSASQIKTSYFVKGNLSGASGYATADGAGTTTIYLRQTSGNFMRGESISIQGNNLDVPRTINTITPYTANEILTVRQTADAGSGYPQSFIANSFLRKVRIPNIDEVDIQSSGTAITAFGQPFSGIRLNDIIRYDKAGADEIFWKVTAISPDSLTLTVAAASASSVSGIYATGGSNYITGTTNLRLGVPDLNNTEAELFEVLPDPNIANVDFSSAVLPVNAQITGESVSSGQLDMSVSSATDGGGVGISSGFFETYGLNRYSVHYGTTNGIGTVTDNNFKLNVNGSNDAQITGLNNTDANTIVSITVKKQGIQSKIKTFSKSKIVEVSLSNKVESGSVEGTTLNDKLTYNNDAYGMRVQDSEISLNVPDVVRVHAIYESIDGLQPTLDTILFSATASVGSNAILGENIVGQSSNAIARVVTNNGSTPGTNSSNKLGIVYLNDKKFTNFERVIFEESNIITNIEGINTSDTEGRYLNITKSFTLDDGQKDQYYDYSRLVRRRNAAIPSRRLLVVYDRYDVPNEDSGDVFSVLSYDQSRYNNDIPLLGRDLIRATDTLDFRPRVSPWTVSTSSPFDFNSRTSSFNTQPKFLVAPNESTFLGYEYYLPRIDKIYLSELGILEYVKGESSINPVAPQVTNQSMELATILLPPYLYNPNNAIILLTDNRRYTMRDIGILDDRISELENVTTLSLLEVGTEALTIEDAQGNTRFKSGFFVDAFRNSELIDPNFSEIQVDPENEEIRPILATNSIQGQLIPAEETVTTLLDFGTNFSLLDSNVQKTGNMVTLAYDEVDYIEQPLATRVENINPFHVISYNGTVTLTPRQDQWIRTLRLDAIELDVEENLTRQLTVTREETHRINTHRRRRRRGWFGRIIGGFGRAIGNLFGFGRGRGNGLPNGLVEGDNHTGTDTWIETTRRVVSGDVIVSDGADGWMRSRNNQFVAEGLKPLMRHYQFLDGNSDVDFIPKLLEITPEKNGTNYGSSNPFKIGETVDGFNDEGEKIISFRVAQANHKSGSFSAADKVYRFNPYAPDETLSSEYTNSSKVVNIDIRSLADEAQGAYSGYVEIGTRLVGQDSKAIAYVKDLRLVSDAMGSLLGSFFLKNPNADPAPTVRIPTGTKTYKLTSSSTNEIRSKGSNLGSAAQANYTSTGRVHTLQHQTRNITTNTTVTQENVTRVIVERGDPLAQSFTVAGNIEAPGTEGPGDDDNGVFITSLDVYFASKDDNNQPVHVQLRTMELGTPTLELLGQTVTLTPDEIITSTDASVPTKVTFPEPVFLTPGLEYCVVLLAPTSDQYEVWIARMGEKTINTQSLPDASSVVYTQQWAIGSLFKSQNGSIWSPSQLEDLKFKLYKAQFTSSTGTAFFTTPTLDESNGYVSSLDSNPIITLPKTGNIGIQTIGGTGITGAGSGISTLTAGRTLLGSSNDGTTAVIVGTGASAYAVNKTNSGSGYETSNNAQTYAITGEGSGLKVNFTVSAAAVDGKSGVIDAVTIATDGGGGVGYKVGDIVGIVTSSVGDQGAGAEITISNTNDEVNTLFLSNIQGTNVSGSFQANGNLRYLNTNGTISTMVGATSPKYGSTGLVLDGIPNDGKHFIVDQFDHGMYGPTNKLQISDIQANTLPAILTSDITSDETTSISVASTSQFNQFEGIPVGVGSTGYLQVENEIIGYKSMTPDGSGGGTLDDLTRGVDGTSQIPHFSADGLEIIKYELNGVSLRRINTSHQISNYNIELDQYHVQIDTTTNGKDRSSDNNGISELSFNENGFAGGDRGLVTRNIQFDSVNPNIRVFTPANVTSVSASMRTVSGTSVGGNEASFEDQGYQPVQLGNQNELSTPRLVCSKINEDTYLTALPRHKAFTTAVLMASSNENVSPVIWADNAIFHFTSNRMNNPVARDAYAQSSLTKSWMDDPHSAVYVSNTVLLEKPADGLKVIVSAYRDETADFRVLYSLVRPDSSEINQSFEFFPGYNNLKDTSGDGFGNFVIDASKNDGLPDAEVLSSLDNEFAEYQFTADGLGDYIGYTIKIVMSGTNQARPVRIRELRSVATK